MRVVTSSGQKFSTFFSQVNISCFFFDGKKERLIYQVHIFGLLLHIVVLCFLKRHFYAFFTQVFDQWAILRQCAVSAQQ